MSDNSAIEWTDATWSPVTGCTRTSEGCLHCYIDRTPPFRMERRRFDGPDIGATTGVRLHPERLGVPLRWRKPRRIFVCSLADLFHDDVPDSYIAEVFAAMAQAPQHTFQVLTKRHARMRSLLGEDGVRLLGAAPDETTVQALYDVWPLPNVWLGVSAENQKWADIRIPALLETPAAVRWVSAEPLLGPVVLAPEWLQADDDACTCSETNGCRELGWVVAGGESGPGAQPMHPDWARSLRDQCVAAGVPFLFKQWGEWRNGSADRRTERGPDHAVHRDGRHVLWSDYANSDLVKGDPLQRHGACVMARVGKKAAGRELDGRTWDQYPTVAVTA